MDVTARATSPPEPAVWVGARAGLGRAVRAGLARLALGAPTRVFVLEGADPPGAPDLLRLRDDVRVVDTPRSATVLLVAGRLSNALVEPARRLHDAMAHPRAVVWWAPGAADGAPADGAGALPVAAVVRPPARGGTAGGAVDLADPLAALDAVAAAIRGVAGELLRGTRASSPGLLPDVDPAPWRGVGPYGQGGSGMTGGVPYGRPMAGRAPDRDALELDQLPVRVGPFFAPFPPGLVLDVRLQGDVLQDVVVPGNAFASAAHAPSSAGADGAPPHGADGHGHAPGHGGPPAPEPAAAAVAPPLVATLERARAHHHLRWLAHALRVHGLDALGRRTLALAVGALCDAPERVAGEVAALGRLLERSRALGWATAGVGVIAADQVAGRGLGPVARAAGHTEDARLGDPVYEALGFAPVVSPRAGGDARDRWRQRLAEAAQGLALAARAGGQRAGEGTGTVEGPRGPRPVGDGSRVGPDGSFGPSPADAPGGASAGASAALLALLPNLLREQEWGDAVTTVVSLALDVREAAPGMAPLAPPPKVKPAGGMGGMGEMRGMTHDMGSMPGGEDEHAGHGGHGGHGA